MDDIRKILNLMEQANQADYDSIIMECMCDEDAQWYNSATNEMIVRIKSGEYPIDVINDLARQYSWKNGGTHEAFSFAKDALDRRAWEMGLRYTDDPHHTTNAGTKSFHDTLITPNVTEDAAELDEEELTEVDWIDRVFKAMSPENYSKYKSSKTVKNMSDKMLAKFLEQFGYDDTKHNVTNLTKHLVQRGFDAAFIQDTVNEFKAGMPNVDLKKPKSLDTVKLFVAAVVANIQDLGGFENVKKGAYVSPNAQANNNSNPAPAQNNNPPKPKPAKQSKEFKTAKTTDELKKLASRLVNSDPTALSQDEVADLKLMLRRFAIPNIK